MILSMRMAMSVVEIGVQGVLGRPHEGVDPQVLPDSLEEEFDLPALLVNGGDCGAAEGQVVGHDNRGRALLGHSGFDQADVIGALLPPFRAGEPDDLVRRNTPVPRCGPILHDLIHRALRGPSDEEDPVRAEWAQLGVDVVPPAEHHDARSGQQEGPGHPDFAGPALRRVHEGGQVALVGDHHVQLHRTFGLPEPDPGEDG